MKNNSTSAEIPQIKKIEKWINDPKSLPIVLGAIALISIVMNSVWGNNLG